jgi:hypothetical protein
MPVFVLVQKNGSLSGTYKGRLGEASVHGMVKGKTVTIEVNSEPAKIRLKGTIDPNGRTMNGDFETVGLGRGTFTATRDSRKQ